MSSSTAYPTGRSLTRLSKPAALGAVAGCYLIAAIAAAVTVAVWRGHHPIAVALLADVVATVVIFALSMAVANSSLYDAYWSVIPPVVAIAWAVAAPAGLSGAEHVRQVLVIVLRVGLGGTAHPQLGVRLDRIRPRGLALREPARGPPAPVPVARGELPGDPADADAGRLRRDAVALARARRAASRLGLPGRGRDGGDGGRHRSRDQGRLAIARVHAGSG